MSTTKDISIGENSWIKWVEFDPKNHYEILEIDGLLQSTFDFWHKLETQCVVACCGIDALAFWEEDIRNAIQSVDKTQLVTSLVHAKEELTRSTKTIVSSSKLNNLLDKGVFIELLDHILRIIQK